MVLKLRILTNYFISAQVARSLHSETTRLIFWAFLRFFSTISNKHIPTTFFVTQTKLVSFYFHLILLSENVMKFFSRVFLLVFFSFSIFCFVFITFFCWLRNLHGKSRSSWYEEDVEREKKFWRKRRDNNEINAWINVQK